MFDAAYRFIDIFYRQVLSRPELLLGLVTLLGNALLRKKIDILIQSTIKTIAGFMLLEQGALMLAKTFRPIVAQLSLVHHLDGAVSDPYVTMMAVVDALGSSYVLVGYTVLLALLLNIALILGRRLTGIRTLFLTGHVMFQEAGLIVAFFVLQLHAAAWVTVLGSSLLTALYWGIGSNLIYRHTEAVTGGAGFSVGHQQQFVSWLACKLAPLLGRAEDSIESVSLPGWLGMFHDNLVATVLLMLLFLGAILSSLGFGPLQQMAGSSHWTVYILETAMMFAVSMAVIIQGVRLFVAELSEAFQGISQRLIPGAVLAIDCAVLFSFAPNAVAWGFIWGALGQLAGVVLLWALGSPIMVIPGFIPMFFSNATVGVYANHYGGWRAAMKICLVLGMLEIAGSAWAVHLSGLTMGWMGMADWATLMPTFMQGMHATPWFALCVAAGAGAYMWRAGSGLRKTEDAGCESLEQGER
ncbi:PTS transporter subunit IIC [Paludibacterium yongneupense]|uniref:PTS transporter subunit IIC n=1 Tax=Paludibacterium yongneupense TaxID=400061 RepID=UPI00041E4246|nr:PTS transporter subunit IIC [Paludibacterium yongneupense]